MKHVVLSKSTEQPRADAWQWACIALCALILCSCRSPGAQRGVISREMAAGGQTCPASVVPASANMPYMEQELSPNEPWAPPGIRRPWPRDEYLRDGGTDDHAVAVNGRGEVAGLGAEDTVAHYTTPDGQIITQPSNEVQIYSPRFAAVRQVVGPEIAGELQRLGDVADKQRLDAPGSLQIAAKAKQNIQPGREIAARPAPVLYSKQGSGAASNVLSPRSFQDRLQPYEDFSIVRLGKYKGTESAFLARGSTAAANWSRIEAVQVILDDKIVEAAVKYDKTLSLYTADLLGKPQLQLVKLASTSSAKPGETVDFTIRFDNIGQQPMKAVTILDSLNGRLEFLPDSAECSVEAKVSTHPNERGSVVVRCELAKPLAPGEGGIFRFRCLVR